MQINAPANTTLAITTLPRLRSSSVTPTFIILRRGRFAVKAMCVDPLESWWHNVEAVEYVTEDHQRSQSVFAIMSYNELVRHLDLICARESVSREY